MRSFLAFLGKTVTKPLRFHPLHCWLPHTQSMTLVLRLFVHLNMSVKDALFASSLSQRVRVSDARDVGIEVLLVVVPLRAVRRMAFWLARVCPFGSASEGVSGKCPAECDKGFGSEQHLVALQEHEHEDCST